MSGSIASAGFGSGFTGALGAVSGAVARAQELAQRQPAADAQELENRTNQGYVDEVENGAFARLAQGRQPQGGAPATPPTGGVQAAGQAPQALAPSAPGTPQPPAGQPPAGGAPQAPTAAPTGQPPPGGAPQAPAPSAPGAAPQAAPSTGQPGAIAAPGAEGGGQPASNPRREAANASANAGRRTAARLAESLGKPVDQLTQADWQLYSNTVEEIARNHPQAAMARRAVSESIKNRSEALAQQSALAYAALQANDLPGFERALNSLNGYTASGFTDRVTTQGGNIVLTRTPESGGGQPQVIPLSRRDAENYVMSMANPLTWQQHLETQRHNRETEQTARGNLGVAQGQLGVLQRDQTNRFDTQGRERELQAAAAANDRAQAEFRALPQDATPEQRTAAQQRVDQTGAALETARGRNQHVPVNATLDQQYQERTRAAEQRHGAANTALREAERSGDQEAIAAARRAVADARDALTLVQQEQASATRRSEETVRIATDSNRRSGETHAAGSAQAAAFAELQTAEQEHARAPTEATAARVQAARQGVIDAARAPGSTPAAVTATGTGARAAADQGQEEADRAAAELYRQLRTRVLADPGNAELIAQLGEARSRLSVNNLNQLSGVESRELQDGIRQEQAALQRQRLELQRQNDASLRERRAAQTANDSARVAQIDAQMAQRAQQFTEREQRLAQKGQAINPQRAQQLSEEMRTGVPTDVGSQQAREFANTAHIYAGPLVMLNPSLDNGGAAAWFRGLSGLTPAQRNVALASGRHEGMTVPAGLQAGALDWLSRNPQGGGQGGPRAATPQTGGVLGDIAGRIGARITAPRPPDPSTAPVAGPAASPSAAPNPAAAPAAPTGRIQNGERTSPFNPTPTPTTPDRRVALAVQSYNESRNTAMGRRVPQAQLMEQAAREAGITVEQLRAALGGQ